MLEQARQPVTQLAGNPNLSRWCVSHASGLALAFVVVADSPAALWLPCAGSTACSVTTSSARLLMRQRWCPLRSPCPPSPSRACVLGLLVHGRLARLRSPLRLCRLPPRRRRLLLLLPLLVRPLLLAPPQRLARLLLQQLPPLPLLLPLPPLPHLHLRRLLAPVATVRVLSLIACHVAAASLARALCLGGAGEDGKKKPSRADKKAEKAAKKAEAGPAAPAAPAEGTLSCLLDLGLVQQALALRACCGGLWGLCGMQRTT